MTGRVAKREHNFPKTTPKRGEIGYYFTVMQEGGASRRKYYVMFKIDAEFKAVWCGGVKANKFTWDRVNAIDWSKPL
jgi:hypothetical protein